MSKVVLFTNFIPPYRKPFFERISAMLEGQITYCLSVPVEANRQWKADWGQLNVRVQRGFRIKYNWKQRSFSEKAFIHVPLDTLPVLFKSRPETIVSAELGFRTLFCCLYKRFRMGTRLVVWATVSEQSEVNRGRMRSVLRRFILRHADLVYTNGQSGIDYLRSISRLTSKRFIRIPYTIDEQLFACTPERGFFRPDCLSLLYVGQVSERKGIREALAVLKDWCRANGTQRVNLKIVGGVSLPDAGILQENLPANLELQFFNHVPYEELGRFYAEADFFLFPTFADEWGVVVNEAMAGAVPVIGSVHSQAVLELVREGQNGWVIDIRQPETLVRALDKAAGLTEEQLKEMRRTASLSLAGYTMEEVAVRFCNHLM